MSTPTLGEKCAKSQEAEAYTAALTAFNVTGFLDTDEECPPEDDTDEEILEELSGVAKGLRTVLLNLDAPDRSQNIQAGLRAAATVTTRLLVRHGHTAVPLTAEPGIYIQGERAFNENAVYLMIHWFRTVMSEVDLSYVTLSPEGKKDAVEVALEVFCRKGKDIFHHTGKIEGK